MVGEAYKTLFGWLNGTRANADATLAADEPNAAEQLLDDMIASLPDAAIVLDRDTRVIAFNSAARVIAPALARGAAAALAFARAGGRRSRGAGYSFGEQFGKQA